jgi:Cdc6-like AAA superfamily ATPase
MAQIFEHRNDQWELSTPWKPQAVIYDKKQEKFLNDIESNSENRRLYLFHGPTGTGKTIFSKYLASKLGRPIYNVLPPVRDDDLYSQYDYCKVGKCRDRISVGDALFENKT